MLTDAMRADGWIEHDGGPCPVASACEVMTRSGLIAFVSHLFAGWSHGPKPNRFDIIAYKPETSR